MHEKIKQLEEQIKNGHGNEKSSKDMEGAKEAFSKANEELLKKISLMTQQNKELRDNNDELQKDKQILEDAEQKREDKLNELRRRDKPMSTSKFKTACIEAGIINANDAIYSDVCHIIANSHGGADHPANYIIGLGAQFNRMISDKLDPLNCFLVGEQRTKAAMRISNRIGNTSRNGKEPIKYKYPYGSLEISASKMCLEGAQMVRNLRNKVTNELKEKGQLGSNAHNSKVK